METRSNVQHRALKVGRAGEGRSLQYQTNVNVLSKTLKHLQVRENSINFAAESYNGCEAKSTTGKKLRIVKITHKFHLLQAWSIVIPSFSSL